MVGPRGRRGRSGSGKARGWISKADGPRSGASTAQRDARVIGTVSTTEKAKAAREAGASEMILYTQIDFAEEVKRLTDGRGVDVEGYRNDTIGREDIDQMAPERIGALPLFSHRATTEGDHTPDGL